MDACVDSSSPTDVWRPIHYLGSKLRVVGPIRDLLDQVDPTRGRLCDLFAGSGTVSLAMSLDRAITASDIQEYSRVLCSALLRRPRMSSDDVKRLHRCAIESQLFGELNWAAESLVSYEAEALDLAKRKTSYPICRLIEAGSIVGFQTAKTTKVRGGLADALQKAHRRLLKLGLAKGPRAVILRHYGGVYFSYSQAIELAVLLDVVSNCCPEWRDTVLAATLSAASHVVNTVGKQFAQPLRPRASDGKPKLHLVKKIVADRQLSVFAEFSYWLDRYTRLMRSTKEHRVFRGDFREIIARECDDVNVVYADPPYTRDHYSRFYHVLETMCLMDDPVVARSHPSSRNIIGRGLYRVDRHQSPFCIKSQAAGAFAELFDGVASRAVPLVLSYSPLAATTKPRPRVIAPSDLVALAKRYFARVELVPAGRISHSKLNRSLVNSEVSHDAELFLVCT